MIHKNLIRAYIERERIETNRQLKLYYFDQSLENMDKALYFGLSSQARNWARELIERGASFMGRLRNIFSEEECEVRADYYEKIFVKMNKQNVDFV